MSYIGDPYQYDVFVSYPHAVDALRGDTNLRDWSQKVAKTILGILRMSLSDEPGGDCLEYYLDREQAVAGYALNDELEPAVQNSAVLVILMSPFYKNWCLKELDWFLEKARKDGRGFRHCVLIEVQKTPESAWPADLRDKAGEPLFRKSLMEEAGLPLGYEQFMTTGTLPNMNGMLQEIAIEIRDKLVKERRQRDAARALAAPKANRRAIVGQDPPEGVLIYLEAETADREIWSNRRDTLAAARAIVLPDEPLDESMANRSESVLSVYTYCDGLILYRARPDDSISPRICRAFQELSLVKQKGRTKKVGWAVLDELPDQPIPYAEAFRIPRVFTRDEDWAEQLIEALGGVPPARGDAVNAVTPVDVLPERPYPGLRPFRQEEWPIFFGREEHADEVIVRLGRHGLVLVHGASGCGKSSLVRAGVLPSLEARHEVAGQVWRTATMRPSEGLLNRLAEVLEELLPPPAGGGRDADEAGAPASSWADFVVKGGGLVDHVEQAVRDSGGGGFCLLIDQFEEIFRWARERSEAETRLFVDFLKRVGGNGEETGFYVILTMRSDYFGQCASYDGFAEFLNPRQYLLPRMDEFGLLRAIYEPAELYGGTIDQAVSAMLLPVVEGHVDGLPVLQHALMRASHHAIERVARGELWRVTADDLAQAGGADHALASHAEEVLAQATGGEPELIEAAEWIFRALTDLDADRRAIRRPCRLSELLEVSGVDRERTLAIIDAFRAPDCTFICPYLPVPIDDETELDISHEALIRQWPRLCNSGIDTRTSRPNGWVYREFHDGLVWRSLVVQATAYAEDPNHLLSVATTEQRLPWFRAIEARPGWTKRHALSERRGDAESTDEQWRNVKAMMGASAHNLARQHGVIGRLRRVRNGSLVLVALFLAAVVALSVISLLLFQGLKDLQEKEAGLLQREAGLLRQRRELAVANEVLLSFGRRVIADTCEGFSTGEEGRAACRVDLEAQFREQYEFQRQARLSGSAAPLPAAPSPRSAPARDATPPDEREP